VDAFLTWMEASALGFAIREAGPTAYAIVNLLHILAIASLFGAVLLLDLRLLGAFRQLRIAELSSATVPVATVGFGLAAVTGVCLLATNATDYIGNGYLLLKFPAIALGVANVAALNLSRAWRERHRRELTREELRQLAVQGAVSLASWLTAISAGRLIAYW
jgi:uncharacterized membrane protein YbhN (UPF0104 family)